MKQKREKMLHTCKASSSGMFELCGISKTVLQLIVYFCSFAIFEACSSFPTNSSVAALLLYSQSLLAPK